MIKKLIIVALLFVTFTIIGLAGITLFVCDDKIDVYATSWSEYASSNLTGTNDMYRISNATELAHFSTNISQYKNSKIIITANIDLEGHNWEPIVDFRGTFDGNNYSINNLCVNGSSVGLFQSINNARIENLYINNAVVYTGIYGSFLTATANNSTITNVFISKSRITSTSDTRYVGGVVGYGNATSITNGFCIDNNISLHISPDKIYAGGVIGYASNCSINSCNNSGDVNVTGYINNCYAGGIAGAVENNSTISMSYNLGKISATTYRSLNYSIEKDNATKSFSGGIAGYEKYSLISNCFNRGQILGNASKCISQRKPIRLNIDFEYGRSEPVKGILCIYKYTVGQKYLNPEVWKYDVYPTPDNYEFVEAQFAYRGGIVAFADGGKISNSYNTGEINTDNSYSKKYIKLYFKLYMAWIGGLISNVCPASTTEIDLNFENSYFFGNIVGNRINNTSIVKNYYLTKYSKTLSFYATQYSHSKRGKVLDSWVPSITKFGRFGILDYNYCSVADAYTIFAIDPDLYSNNINFLIRWYKTSFRSYYRYYDINIDNTRFNRRELVEYSQNSGAKIGINIQNFDSKIWAKDNAINDGFPYLKVFYWQDVAEA